MRLTCPNCSARYEVADSMIPPDGRDVQCSNCSTTWFQPGRRGEPPAAPAPPPPPPPPVDEVEPEPAPVPDAPQPQRQTLDPALRSILQEEAEREVRLRRAEAGTVETQAEMPLGETREALARAELDSAPDAFDPGPSIAGARHGGQTARDLFPDIEEINSTLRDTADRSGDEPEASDIDTLDTVPRRKRGVRIGFFTMILIAAVAAALYVNAGRVAATVPALAPVLGGYVETVNTIRFWLDDLAQGLGTSSADGG